MKRVRERKGGRDLKGDTVRFPVLVPPSVQQHLTRTKNWIGWYKNIKSHMKKNEEKNKNMYAYIYIYIRRIMETKSPLHGKREGIRYGH